MTKWTLGNLCDPTTARVVEYIKQKLVQVLNSFLLFSFFLYGPLFLQPQAFPSRPAVLHTFPVSHLPMSFFHVIRGTRYSACCRTDCYMASLLLRIHTYIRLFRRLPKISALSALQPLSTCLQNNYTAPLQI